MPHNSNILDRQRRETARVFRLAERDHGLTLKAIALDSGLGYSTVQTYASGQAVMSIASLFCLVGVIPDELLSLLLPDGRQIVQAPDGIDHDALSELAREYVDAKMAAHRHDSECAELIGPKERADLNGKATRLKAV